MRKKFEPSSCIPAKGTKERELLDQRFQVALKRLEQDPEYQRIRDVCRRAGDIDLRIVINV